MSGEFDPWASQPASDLLPDYPTTDDGHISSAPLLDDFDFDFNFDLSGNENGNDELLGLSPARKKMALGPMPTERTPVETWHCIEPSSIERASEPSDTLEPSEKTERTPADSSSPECLQVGTNPGIQLPEPPAPTHTTRPLTPPPTSATVGIMGRLNTPA